MESENIEQGAEKNNTEQEEVLLRRSREIAGQGDYWKIREMLRDENLIDMNIKRIHEQWGDALPLNFFKKDDWELLTALELFHPETFEHSLRTYLTAKEKVEKRLSYDIVLKDLFLREGVSLEQFYRSCLFHDIGKTALPQAIIQNSVSKDRAVEILTNLVNQRSDDALAKKMGFDYLSNAPYSREDIIQTLERTGIHPQKIIPIEFILSPEDIALAEQRGFRKEMLLGELLEIHEEQSGAILNRLGFTTESEIVRQHHNYRHEPLSHPIAIESLQISVDIADLLHLADIMDALRHKRSYKKDFSLLESLGVLASHAEQGLVGQEITHLWIADELKKLENISAATLSAKDQQSLNQVRSFLTHSELRLKQWVTVRNINTR